MGRKKSDEAGTPISIRLSAELQAQLEYAAKQLHLSVHDVMRKTMRLGLKHYERIGWDEESAVLGASLQTKAPLPFPQTQPSDEKLVAERPNTPPLSAEEIAKQQASVSYVTRKKRQS